MTQMDGAAAAYLARRDVSAQWRGFLRALVETLDTHLDAASRDGLLRSVGARMGGLLPLPPAGTLAELEAAMNEALAGAAWGYVSVQLDQGDRTLVLVHSLAPLVTRPGDSQGAWIGPVLEGLYGAWLRAQQGGQESEAQLRVARCVPGQVVLRYGQG
jgi:hypothetical protein